MLVHVIRVQYANPEAEVELPQDFVINFRLEWPADHITGYLLDQAVEELFGKECRPFVLQYETLDKKPQSIPKGNPA